MPTMYFWSGGGRGALAILNAQPMPYEHIRQAYQSDLFSIFAPDVPVGEAAARADPALVKRFMDSDPAWKLARRYVFECMEHRREHGRAVMSSEESCGSSSVEDSGLWTEEVDEELESHNYITKWPLPQKGGAPVKGPT